MATWRLKQGPAWFPGTRPFPRWSATVASICSNERRQIPILCSFAPMIASVGENRIRSVHPQTRAIRINRGRALRPHGPDQVQPTFQSFAELAGTTVIGTAQLTHKPAVAEQRNSFATFRNETSVRKPCEEVERRWRTRQRLGSLHVRRYRMREDLPEEFIAEDDFILKFAWQGLLIG